MRTLALITLGALSGYCLANALSVLTVVREAYTAGGRDIPPPRAWDEAWRDVEEDTYG